MDEIQIEFLFDEQQCVVGDTVFEANTQLSAAGCSGCEIKTTKYFQNGCAFRFRCIASERKDKTSIIWKQV